MSLDISITFGYTDDAGWTNNQQETGEMSERESAASSNRERIIAAAYRVLAERGYEATTIKEVARVAGVAPGLIHYYFKNKEEVLTAVLKAESEQFTRDQQGALTTRGQQSPIDAALVGPLSRTREHPERHRLRYELFALGLHRPDILRDVDELLANGREGIANDIRRVTQGRMPEAQAQSLAAILVTTFDGLALQTLVNPDFDLDGAYAVLARMLIAYLTQTS